MKVYFYDEKTFEYLGEQEADKNPAASERTGEFVPLVPANATLIRPMASLQNQIQVFDKNAEIWRLYDDFRENFSKVDEYLNVLGITEIGGIEEGYILVSKELGEEIKEDVLRFKIKDGKIIRKTDEEYNKDILEQAKAFKYFENENLSNVTRYNKEFSMIIQDKICVFDTSSTTQADLLTAFAVCSTGITYDGWITNNGVELNLTFEEVASISSKFKELSNVYPKWKYFKDLIDKAETLEDVEAIVIDYGNEV